MMRLLLTMIAPTRRRRHVERSETSAAIFMKYSSQLGLAVMAAPVPRRPPRPRHA
jgi:hypothetical protein